MQQLGGIDAAMIYLESAAMPMHTGGMLVYDPAAATGRQVSAEQVAARVHERLARSASLRRRVAKIPFDLDLPYWLEGEVELEHHVLHDPLRDPGDWRQLCSQVASFLERPLDMSRPLWELCLIDGLDRVEGMPAGSFALAMKVHHAVVDGIGGLELLAALHDTQPDPDPDGRARTPAAENPSWLSLLRKPLQPSVRMTNGTLAVTVPDITRRPWRLLGVVGGLGVGYAKRSVTSKAVPVAVPEGVPDPPATAVPQTRFNAALGGSRSVGGIRLDLSAVKAVKNLEPGLTVNDVVLAVVSGALRRYLDEAHELPAESLVSVMPMSVRTVDEAGVGGNRFSVSTVALGTQLADPLDRLRAVHRAARRGKSVLAGPAARSAVTLADSVPAGVLGVVKRLLPHVDLSSKLRVVNTGVTNVPGPQVPLYLCGAELAAMYGYALIVPGVGLMHMATGIRGTLTLGFQADAAMVPDPGHYEDCLRDAFRELQDAACGA